MVKLNRSELLASAQDQSKSTQTEKGCGGWFGDSSCVHKKGIELCTFGHFCRSVIIESFDCEVLRGAVSCKCSSDKQSIAPGDFTDTVGIGALVDAVKVNRAASDSGRSTTIIDERLNAVGVTSIRCY